MYFVIGLCHHSALLGPLQPLHNSPQNSLHTRAHGSLLLILWHMGPIAKGPNQCFYQHGPHQTPTNILQISNWVSGMKTGRAWKRVMWMQNTKSESKPSSSLIRGSASSSSLKLCFYYIKLTIWILLLHFILFGVKSSFKLHFFISIFLMFINVFFSLLRGSFTYIEELFSPLDMSTTPNHLMWV